MNGEMFEMELENARIVSLVSMMTRKEIGKQIIQFRTVQNE